MNENAERLNRAAELLGLDQRMSTEGGSNSGEFTEHVSKLLEALAERVRALEKLNVTGL